MQESLLILVINHPSGEITKTWRTPTVDEQGRTLGLTPPKPEENFVAVTIDEKGIPVDPLFLAVVRGLRWPNSGPLRWRWNGAQPWTPYAFGDAADLVEIPDPRFPVRVTQTPNPGLVGQALTVRLEVLNAAGNVRTNLNTTATVKLLDQNGRGRRAAVNIVSGVAERTFIPSESGEIELISDVDQVVFQGDNPVVIDEAW